MVYDSLNFLHYWRLTPDNRMLFGGRAAFFPETANTIRQSEQILQRDFIAIHPQLKNTKVDYAWGGTLDFTFDIRPAGEFDGVHYALGYAGHGVAMATYLGKIMGERLAGGPDANPFRGHRFPRRSPRSLQRTSPGSCPSPAHITSCSTGSANRFHRRLRLARPRKQPHDHVSHRTNRQRNQPIARVLARRERNAPNQYGATTQ